MSQTVIKSHLFLLWLCVSLLGLQLNLVPCKSTSEKKTCGGGASLLEPQRDAALAL